MGGVHDPSHALRHPPHSLLQHFCVWKQKAAYEDGELPPPSQGDGGGRRRKRGAHNLAGVPLN